MTQEIIDELDLNSMSAIDHLHNEFAKIQTGRANAALVENVMVDSYGVKVQLRSVASITIPEFKQIAIQPFSRDQLTNIEKAIKDANLGINPQNDGIVIRLNIPPLTEERRRDLVKLVHRLAEDGKIAIRNARHEAITALKAMEKKKEISEDELHSKEKVVQEKVDAANAQIEEILNKKEKDVMTV